MNFLKLLIAGRLSRPQRIPILLPRLNIATILIKDNGNNFQVIIKVNFLVICSEVLDEWSTGDVSLQVFDVVLDHFGFVGDWEVEGVVA